MRFALHLLAALLLIEEDAGCHEDGTADDERLADESRAVAGLGEAAGWAVSVPARCFGVYAACCFAASSASCRAISSESFCSAAMRSDFADS